MVSMELRLPAPTCLPEARRRHWLPGTVRTNQAAAAASEVTGMITSPLNHYQALMVDPEVDADILGTVYRRLVQRFQSPLDRSGTTLQRLREVEDAYAVLRDPRRRARYDAQLEERMRHGDPDAPAFVAPTERPMTPPVVATQTGARAAFSRPAAPHVASQSRASWAAVPVSSGRPSATRSAQVSVLDFGRYAGWTLRQLAARDPDYLEWLLRSPGGRQYRAEITALLEPR
jgi:hypothetical protein